MKRFILTLAFAAYANCVALAAGQVPSYIISQSDAPITINSCPTWLTDTDVGNYNYYLRETVAFTNNSDVVARAVRFRFSLFTTFNEHIDDLYATVQGNFSPGTLIDYTHPKAAAWFVTAGRADAALWQSINIWPSLATIQCSVDTVAFIDGSTWRNGARQQATVGAAPSETDLQRKCDTEWAQQDWLDAAATCLKAREISYKELNSGALTMDSTKAGRWLRTAICGARAAYAYGRIGRSDLAKSTLGQVSNDLTVGKIGADGPQLASIASLQSLIQSPKFLDLDTGTVVHYLQ